MWMGLFKQPGEGGFRNCVQTEVQAYVSVQDEKKKKKDPLHLVEH